MGGMLLVDTVGLVCATLILRDVIRIIGSHINNTYTEEQIGIDREIIRGGDYPFQYGVFRAYKRVYKNGKIRIVGKTHKF